MVRTSEKAKGKRAKTDQGSTSQAPYEIVRHANPVWPRQEETQFAVEFISETKTLKSVLTSKDVDARPVKGTWDNYDSLLYNEWLRVPMAPTKFACPNAMIRLNIHDEVMGLVEKVGMTKLVTHNQGLYPDLVRQFFATVKLTNDGTTDEEKRDPKHFIMTFMSSGTRYAISAKEIARVYEFPEVPAGDLPLEIYAGMDKLWNMIGTRPYVVGSSTYTDIRHPVLRYLVRLFSTTILCKLEPGKVRKHELVLLSYALRDIIPNETWSTGFQPNLAMVFMDYLHSLRHTPVSVTSFGKRQFTMGSLLTPIFVRARVSFTGYTIDRNLAYVDMEHMKKAHWIKDDRYICWVFPIALGQPRMVEIGSVAHLMPISTDASLIPFEPEENLLRAVEATRRIVTRGTGISRPSSSQAPRVQPRHEHVFPSMPPGLMDDNPQLSWIAKALKATWDAVSCKSDCARPRTPSPRNTPSPDHDDDEEEA